MKHDFAARLVLALSLTMTLPIATAMQETLPQKPGNEITLPAQTESQTGSESNPAITPTGSRGEMLYENQCQGCHTSIVHVREKHRANSRKELEQWVTHWAGELKLPWSTDEINAVVDYLNQAYYKVK